MEGDAWTMNAACWREVALRGGLSVVDVLSLRGVCQRLCAVFASGARHNQLWFTLYRNSCALYPDLHSTWCALSTGQRACDF